MSKKKKKYLNAGDIVCQKITSNGKYVFGRVLINLKHLDINHKSSLRFFKNNYLVECYDLINKEPSIANKQFDVLIKGVFMDNFAWEENQWEVIGNKEVKPEEIDFPIYLYNAGGRIVCVRGELAFKTKISIDEYWDLGNMGSLHSGAALKNYVLFYLEKFEWMHPIWREKTTLADSDIRYNKDLYNSLVEYIPEFLTLDYQNLCTKYGIDINKLIKN